MGIWNSGGVQASHGVALAEKGFSVSLKGMGATEMTATRRRGSIRRRHSRLRAGIGRMAAYELGGGGPELSPWRGVGSNLARRPAVKSRCSSHRGPSRRKHSRMLSRAGPFFVTLLGGRGYILLQPRRLLAGKRLLADPSPPHRPVGGSLNGNRWGEGSPGAVERGPWLRIVASVATSACRVAVCGAPRFAGGRVGVVRWYQWPCRPLEGARRGKRVARKEGSVGLNCKSLGIRHTATYGAEWGESWEGRREGVMGGAGSSKSGGRGPGCIILGSRGWGWLCVET